MVSEDGMSTDEATREIEAGDRFGFGENWTRFLDLVDEERIQAAVESLSNYLGTDNLAEATFVDAGSGSGLFSLAARRLGASVVSFDFDPSSVACTREMRRRYAPDDPLWQVLQGSVLDSDFLSGLGTFDIVYSWGVLHHTGEMWRALELVETLVGPGGRLFIAIYNDQGRGSRMWTRVKRAYNGAGPGRRKVILEAANLYFTARGMDAARRIYRTVRRLPSPPNQGRGRGMDRRRDLVDWVGGYPFEVARPEEIFDFFRARGFVLERLSTCGGGLGNNQFVFRRA